MQIHEIFSLQLLIKRDQNSLYLHLVKGSKIHIILSTCPLKFIQKQQFLYVQYIQ